MKNAGYIVTKGGRPMALVPVPAINSGVLIFGEPVAMFRSEDAATDAIVLTLKRSSQLRGAKIAVGARDKKRAIEDARLFDILPIVAEGKA